MKKALFIVILFIVLIMDASAQELIEINTANRCIHKGDSIETELYKFPLTEPVPTIVEKILTATSKTQNFELIETNVANVVAVVDGAKRYILYNPDFIHRIDNSWSIYAIIAHALGHHVNFHTLLKERRQIEEEEADKFQGFVLGLLGAPKSSLPCPPDCSEFKINLSESAIEGFNKSDTLLLFEKSLEYFKDKQGNLNLPIPQFELPPSKPSAFFVIEDAFKQCKNLADIDAKLRTSLSGNGYYDKSYYCVPNGFVLITRLEQINDDATSKKEPHRWNLQVTSNEAFSLIGYLKALFTAQPGYFRIIAFVVTPHSFTMSGPKVSREEAMAWLSEGANVLPSEIGKIIFNKNYNVTALVYEFKTYGSIKEPTVLTPSNHTGKTHLERSNIWKFLKN